VSSSIFQAVPDWSFTFRSHAPGWVILMWTSPASFSKAWSTTTLITMHIDNLRGINAHHQCETVFKACGRALRMALELDPRAAGMVPSTKGVL